MSLKYKAKVYMRDSPGFRAESDDLKTLIKMCKTFSLNNKDHHKTKVYNEDEKLGTVRKGKYREL